VTRRWSAALPDRAQVTGGSIGL